MNIIISFLQGLSPDFDRFYIVSPGSKIPEWFSNQIVGDSLVVELPLDSFSRWKGIAFCVVFADQEINTEALDQFSCYFRITCLSEGSYCANWVTGVGEVVRDHLWLFYMPSENFGIPHPQAGGFHLKPVVVQHRVIIRNTQQHG